MQPKIYSLDEGLQINEPLPPDELKGKAKRRVPGAVTPEGIMIDEVLTEGKPQLLASHHEGFVKRADGFVRDGVVFTPLDDQLLQKGAVSLPSKVERYESEIELCNDLDTFISIYVDVNPTFRKLCVLYVLTSWLYDKCPALPILNLRGPSETGKSRLGEVMRHLCYRGMRASGVMSLSSLFRNAERWQGTLYVNEADMKASTEEAQIVKLLNERYERGGIVWRMDSETLKPEVFRVFGPTILVTRKGFFDDALESRCIVVPMIQTERTDIPLNLPPEFYDQAQHLRNRLLWFRFRNYPRFEVDYGLRFEEIGPRMNQVLQPVASLAKLVNPDLFKFIDGIAKELYERVIEERAHSPDGFIIRSYVGLEAEGKEAITPSDLSDRIQESFGFDLNPPRVGRRLASLGYKTIKVDRKHRIVRIPKEDLVKLVRRYLPRDEREEWQARHVQLKIGEAGGDG